MRMVFADADEDDFYPSRDRLVRAFTKWARKRRRAVDSFAVEALVDHRWEDGDGLLGRWQPADLTESLCDWFPRKVTIPPGEWGTVVPTVHAFVDFLFDADLADARCATPERLHATLDGLADDFDAAMGDETRYGIAKFWTMRMLAAGVDPSDEEATQEYIAGVHAGRIATDQHVLDQVMNNHLAAQNASRPPPLPVIDLLDADTLRPHAAGSLAIRRILAFVGWVGAGRTLTGTGRLRLADARELTALLGTTDVINPTSRPRSSDELYEVNIAFEWAKAARVVRVVKGRVIPVKSAAKLLTDPLALAERAFAGLLTMGEAVCDDDSMMRWQFDSATLAVVMTLYQTRETTPVEFLHEIAARVINGMLSDDDDLWRKTCDAVTDRLLALLGALDAVDLDRDTATLTPLGYALTAAYLRGMGVVVPTIDLLLDETAEVVVDAAADSPPEIRDALLTRWCAHNTTTAQADLRALAARTDDRQHRNLAERFAQGAPRRERPRTKTSGVPLRS